MKIKKRNKSTPNNVISLDKSDESNYIKVGKKSDGNHNIEVENIQGKKANTRNTILLNEKVPELVNRAEEDYSPRVVKHYTSQKPGILFLQQLSNLVGGKGRHFKDNCLLTSSLFRYKSLLMIGSF